MKAKSILLIKFLFLFFIFFIDAADAQEKSLRVNIFTRNNGVGLERDAKILKAALLSFGVDARIYPVDQVSQKIHWANINIFFEIPASRFFSKAKRNWYVPNPEWCGYPMDTIKRIDLILCRTHEVERIFNKLGMPTYYLGFTSLDRYDPLIQKNPRQLLHLAGKSVQKGTERVLQLWKERPDYPILNIIRLKDHVPNLHNISAHRSYVPEQELISLQNESGIHLCPSETEGFGHYLMEAMSAKAVVLTTNAPPMNEFISDPRCLVEYSSTAKQWLATNYYVDINDLDAKIVAAMDLTDEELLEIGENNRQEYLRRTQEFMSNLEKLVDF